MKAAERIAIVTGASRGIGRFIAIRLARDGFAVVVNYAQSAQDGERVVAEITAAGGQASAVRADVSVPNDALQLFAQAQEAFGAIDVLVNNAGMFEPERLAEATDEQFDRHVNGYPIPQLRSFEYPHPVEMLLRDLSGRGRP